MNATKTIAAFCLFAVLFISVVSTPVHASFKDDFVDLMNAYYGNVCRVKIEGVFTKTIRVDWTSQTVMLHTIKIFAEIGDAKDKLYSDGVRYFKFPNDAGTYNVIDWKTGEKKLDHDRALYYFSN